MLNDLVRKMKPLLLCPFLVFLLSAALQADTIVLKGGQKLEGKILA